MASEPRVLVVGGSLGGLAAGVALTGAGWDVDVFERTPAPLEGRGAGIVLHPATMRCLAGGDFADAQALSVGADWLRYLDRDGVVVHEEPCQYRFTSYNVLYRALLTSFGTDRYHLGEEAATLEREPGRALVGFSSGRVEAGQMVVFADGVNSAGRRQLLPDVEPAYAGYIAWRGTVAEGDLAAAVFDSLHSAVTYHLEPAGGHLLVYPIPAERPAGRRLLNWLWYRNVVHDALPDLLVDRGGVRYGASVPPGLVQERHIEQLSADARGVLPASLAELVAVTPEPFIQVVVDVAVSRMAFGRVCLIGDAAFTARPHVAAGSAKAADDAWQLAQSLRPGVLALERALLAWERRQLALGLEVLSRARQAGARAQFEGSWQPGEQLPFGLYRAGDSAFPPDRREERPDAVAGQSPS